MKKKLLLLLALLLTAATGAWAQEETLLTTITATGNPTFISTPYSVSTPGIVTVTLTNIDDYQYFNNMFFGWSRTQSGNATVAVEALQGYTITRCVYTTYPSRTFEDDLTPFVVTLTPTKMTAVTSRGEETAAEEMSSIATIDVYGYRIVHLLTLPLSVTGGTVAIDGFDGVTLPEGFEAGDTEGTYNVAEGTEFTVTATPNAGYYFTGWADDPNNKSLTRNITMGSNDIDLTPTFAQMSLLTLQTVGEGTVEVIPSSDITPIEGQEGKYYVMPGASVTVKATPTESTYFVNWNDEAAINSSTAVDRTFKIPAEATSLSATFAAKHVLTLQTVGNGTVAFEGFTPPNYPDGVMAGPTENTYYVMPGTELKAVATATTGNYIASWSNGDQVADLLVDTNTFTVNETMTLTANFAETPLLSLNSTGNGTVELGGFIPVTPVPVTVTFQANSKTKTVENVTLPYTFMCSYNGENGELDYIIRELYGLAYGYCLGSNRPQASGNANVTAGRGSNNRDHYITISAPYEGAAQVTGTYVSRDKDGWNTQNVPYTLTITVSPTSYAPAVYPAGITAGPTENTYRVMPGTNVTLKAEANDGYNATGWQQGDEAVTEGVAYADYYDESEQRMPKTSTMTFQMGANTEALTVTAIFAENEYNITFNAANAYTIEAGKATVTVGGTAATVTEGKLQGVKMGSEVKLEAKPGYKFRKVEVKKGAAAASDVEVTTNAAQAGDFFTEAWFTMPAFDATADYELVRDMSIQMTAQVGDGTQEQPRYRVKKDGNKFIPADMEITAVPALFTVNDAIEQKALTLDQDYIVQIYAIDAEGQPTGDPMTFATFTFEPGIYAVKAVAAQGSDYDGETALSNTFKLFQGYEVEIAAQSFATYYKDEALTIDESTAEDAALYTISEVTATEAVLSDEIEAAPKSTPLLVFNNSDKARTILLIPTNEPNLALTVAPEFKGTLTAKSFSEADMEAANFYVLTDANAFVWVKGAGTIAANKCWLQIEKTAPNNTRAIVFDNDATAISEIPGESGLSGDWYDISGRKVSNSQQPKTKGLYINGGRKVVIK